MKFALMPMVYAPSTLAPTLTFRGRSLKHALTILALQILSLMLLWQPSHLPSAEIETLSWPDGTRYVGAVKGAQMHGQGTIYWQDGTRYVGGFENHERHGPGMMILPDGTTFEGVFKRGTLEPSQSSESVNEPDTATTEASQETIRGVTDALDFWAAAWMAQNPDQYLSVYSPDFQLAVNESRPAWEMNRRERLLSPSYIQLDVRFDRFTQRANGEVEAQIRQAYRSDSYREISNKILVLEKRDGRWLIREERQP
jgi:hypothetical protein